MADGRISKTWGWLHRNEEIEEGLGTISALSGFFPSVRLITTLRDADTFPTIDLDQLGSGAMPC